MERYEVHFNSTAGMDYVRDTQAGKIMSVAEIVGLLNQRDALAAALREIMERHGDSPRFDAVGCEPCDCSACGRARAALALLAADTAGTVEEVS